MEGLRRSDREVLYRHAGLKLCIALQGHRENIKRENLL